MDYESLKSLSNEQLVKMVNEGNNDAKNCLLENNKGLVMKYAKKYSGMCSNSLSDDDLYIAGQIGLLNAIDHFDHNFDNSFSTYAVHWIHKAIIAEIHNYGYTIRIPAQMQERISKVRKIIRKLASRGIQEEDLIEEVVNELKGTNTPLNMEQVIECIQISHQVMSCVSLDMPKDEGSNVTLGDSIPSDIKGNPEIIMDQLEKKEHIKNLLDKLDNQEKAIISARYNLDGKGCRSLEEAAKEFNVTREHVRYIDAKARRKMKE